MLSLWDMYTANAIAAYYEEKPSNAVPYLGPTFFPAKKKVGLKLEWIKGYDSVPVALAPAAFDAKPPIRDRGGISVESTRMPFFREAMRIGEEDRQQIMTFMDSKRDELLKQAVTKIFDDASQLIDAADVIPEIMIMGLLTEGKFAIASETESGLLANYEYNYDPAGTWAENNKTALTDGKWSVATSNPILDILAVKKEARSRGTILTRAITGYDTWLDIFNCETIKKAMNPIGNQNMIITEEEVKAYVERMTGLKIVVYDKVYKDTQREDQFFYPQRGHFTLLPGSPVGSTYYGTTPEEADVLYAKTNAKVSIVNTGVAVLTELESTTPVNIKTVVSEIVLPSFENMDKVYNITYDAE